MAFGAAAGAFNRKKHDDELALKYAQLRQNAALQAAAIAQRARQFSEQQKMAQAEMDRRDKRENRSDAWSDAINEQAMKLRSAQIEEANARMQAFREAGRREREQLANRDRLAQTGIAAALQATLESGGIMPASVLPLLREHLPGTDPQGGMLVNGKFVVDFKRQDGSIGREVFDPGIIRATMVSLYGEDAVAAWGFGGGQPRKLSSAELSALQIIAEGGDSRAAQAQAMLDQYFGFQVGMEEPKPAPEEPEGKSWLQRVGDRLGRGKKDREVPELPVLGVGEDAAAVLQSGRTPAPAQAGGAAGQVRNQSGAGTGQVGAAAAVQGGAPDRDSIRQTLTNAIDVLNQRIAGGAAGAAILKAREDTQRALADLDADDDDDDGGGDGGGDGGAGSSGGK